MKILSLVTNRYAPFYTEQTEVLNRNGVQIDHCYPASQSTSPAGQQSIDRSISEYLGLYARILRRNMNRYDLVHVNYGLLAPFALAQFHRPIVLTLWGSDLTGKVGKLSRWCANLCAEVIVMSEKMAEAIERDVHIIPHGIDLDLFAPMDRTAAQAAVGWNSEQKHILFPYHPSRSVKNYPLAEQVVTKVRHRISTPVKLQVVYDVAHEKVPYYMNAADALLLTSQREGFPNSVKEAMACNLPVVSTDVGDVSRYLEHIDQSYTGRTETELVEHLTSVLRRNERSDGRAYAMEFGVENMGNMIISVYENAVDK